MAWIEVHITACAEHVDALNEQLIELGAVAVTLQDAGDQPIYEPAPDSSPVWPLTIVTGLFDRDHPLTPVMTYLNQQEKDGKLHHFLFKDLEDQDWVRLCLESFKPLAFGKRLWICPSWLTPPDPTAINVILDPGLAFGTGTHPTTALCLKWLDQHPPKEANVIDYGCGSGILGIAALKLGAKKVFAVDNDPQALAATRKNAADNQIRDAQLEICLPEKLPPMKANLLIANILAQPLIELAPRFADLTAAGGYILLSGILSHQIPLIQQAYAPWFTLETPALQADWVHLTGIRK